MILSKIRDDIVSISGVTGQNTLINNSIQHALERIYSAFDFPYYLQDTGVIKTIAVYNTGTINVTNGSTAIAGNATAFTTSMAGRKIQISGQNAIYRIASYSSPTSLTLEQPFQGVDATLQNYTIFQDEYRIASDCDKFKTFRQLQNNLTLFQMPVTRFDELHAMPNALADPLYAMMVGTKLDVYNTGTVSAVANTNIITGVGTLWTSVDGLGRMTNITAPPGTVNSTYTIKSVDSDTQITVYETILNTIPALSTYEIKLNNLRVQLYQVPNAQRLLYYRYFRIPELLVNDWDVPDLPHSWHWLLVYGALADVFLQKGDMQKAWEACESKFQSGIGLMRQKLGSFAPDMKYKFKSLDRMVRGVNDGLEASNYDKRWSMP